MATLYDLLKTKFAIKTRAVENPLVTEVGTTAQLVLLNNPNRLGFVIQNLSTSADIYIGLDHTVSGTKGIKLAPGGSLSAVWDEDFEAVAWARWGIASAAGSPIYILEVVST